MARYFVHSNLFGFLFDLHLGKERRRKSCFVACESKGGRKALAVKKDNPFDKTPPMAHLPTHTNTTDLERRIVYIQSHRCA